MACADPTTLNTPPWDSFHSVLSAGENLDVSNVAFNPILMACPTDHATIYTTLLHSKEAINALGFEHAPVFFDMGLLSKAMEITWANPDSLSGVIPCDGGMHFLMSVLSGIGKIYGDAGLRNLLCESGVFAAGSVQNILSGKDFDRAIRAMKLVDEALTRRFLLHFENWGTQNNCAIPEELSTLLTQRRECFSNMPGTPNILAIIDELGIEVVTHIIPLLIEFRTQGRATSTTFRFWDDFLCHITLPLKMFLSGTKCANWNVYQAAKAKLLPHLFSSNRSTYAKYMPVLLIQMRRLPPDVTDAFQDGLFVAKLSEGKFNAVWIDYALEVTENKALKGTGGIIGLTLRGNALTRWFLARPLTAKYSMKFHIDVCQRHCGKETTSHRNSLPSNTRKWNDSVDKTARMFDESCIDPFDLADPPSRLVNIATGMIATPEVEESLITCHDRGSTAARKFVTQRLVTAEGNSAPEKSMYSPATRTKLLTMSDMHKPIRIGSKKIALNSEVAYLRLMALNARKKIPMRILRYH